eukprot:gene14083-5069_t
MSGNWKGTNRKRNKKFYCGHDAKKKRIEDLAPGVKGFLITCNERKEAPVVSEAYALLNEYADIIYGPEKIDEENPNSESSDEGEDKNIEDALKKEVSELKSRKFKERRFKAAKVKIKNLVFIKTTLDDPNKLTEAIFTDLEKQKVTKTRRCIKCIPIMATCYASENAIKIQTEKLFKEFFEQGRADATYCIVFKARCNNTVKRDGVIQEMGKIIEDLNEQWSVNYHDPDYTIAVHVITNVCGIGILPHFKKFRNYNLQSFGLENKAKESKGKTPESTVGCKDMSSAEKIKTEMDEDRNCNRECEESTRKGAEAREISSIEKVGATEEEDRNCESDRKDSIGKDADNFDNSTNIENASLKSPDDELINKDEISSNVEE